PISVTGTPRVLQPCGSIFRPQLRGECRMREGDALHPLRVGERLAVPPMQAGPKFGQFVRRVIKRTQLHVPTHGGLLSDAPDSARDSAPSSRASAPSNGLKSSDTNRL